MKLSHGNGREIKGQTPWYNDVLYSLSKQTCSSSYENNNAGLKACMSVNQAYKQLLAARRFPPVSPSSF